MQPDVYPGLDHQDHRACLGPIRSALPDAMHRHDESRWLEGMLLDEGISDTKVQEQLSG